MFVLGCPQQPLKSFELLPGELPLLVGALERLVLQGIEDDLLDGDLLSEGPQTAAVVGHSAEWRQTKERNGQAAAPPPQAMRKRLLQRQAAVEVGCRCCETVCRAVCCKEMNGREKVGEFVTRCFRGEGPNREHAWGGKWGKARRVWVGKATIRRLQRLRALWVTLTGGPMHRYIRNQKP